MKEDYIITEDGYKVCKKSYTEMFEERMRKEARKDKTEPKPQKNRKKAD